MTEVVSMCDNKGCDLSASRAIEISWDIGKDPEVRIMCTPCADFALSRHVPGSAFTFKEVL